MKRHIFLIDDDEDDVSFFLAAMGDADDSFKCTWARSGEHALKQLIYLTPDIIFLDINMPGMNGLECLAEIRKIPCLQAVPVILHSSGFNASYKQKGMELGAYACLEKPDTSAALAEIFANLVPGKATAG
jgi:CheY-like chemotaxis protein